MKDINIDPSATKMDINDNINKYIQEIVMILNTAPHEVMGSFGMPLDLERLVYETNIDNKALEREIMTKIREYSTYYDMFHTEVEVSFMETEERDTCIIDITINYTKKLSFVIR